MKTTLNTIPLTQTVKIEKLNCTGKTRRRLLDLGFVKNSHITAILSSPSGNLNAYEIRGTLIAIRDEDAKNILVSDDI